MASLRVTLEAIQDDALQRVRVGVVGGVRVTSLTRSSEASSNGRRACASCHLLCEERTRPASVRLRLGLARVETRGRAELVDRVGQVAPSAAGSGRTRCGPGTPAVGPRPRPRSAGPGSVPVAPDACRDLRLPVIVWPG